ncbi:replication protein A 32 kDa subunit-A-like [Copidosoma floridanum]|uniref:replication protein A 32 kDa subunit-A-like n=1 Tax=Copidosoma floridanum TaxID=29053 RepID=UPI0006C98500|nr:replication protein A 32 kDa subunit-A-like [Copidosoma floridanum]
MWGNNTEESILEEKNVNTSLNTFGDSKSFKCGQNCIPLMVAHLQRYHDNIQVWGMPARLMTLVVILRRIENLSTKVSFLLEDETGTIQGIKWLDGECRSMFQCPVALDSYARIYGYVRHQHNETHVLVMNIQPIEHLNELLAHLMEVTMISLAGEKMLDQVQNVAVGNTFASHSENLANASNEAINIHAGLSTEQILIFDIVKKNSDQEYGADRKEIKSKAPHYLLDKVDQILEFLSSEGHVYTTQTDDYFKAI